MANLSSKMVLLSSIISLAAIDHQLRFVRLFCNHSKHKTDSGQIPKIISTYGANLPMTLPAKLCTIMAVGSLELDAEYLFLKIYNYWKEILKTLKPDK